MKNSSREGVRKNSVDGSLKRSYNQKKNNREKQTNTRKAPKQKKSIRRLPQGARNPGKNAGVKKGPLTVHPKDFRSRGGAKKTETSREGPKA